MIDRISGAWAKALYTVKPFGTMRDRDRKLRFVVRCPHCYETVNVRLKGLDMRREYRAECPECKNALWVTP